MKIHPMGAGVFLADGQAGRQIDGHADVAKLIVAFANLRGRLKSDLSLAQHSPFGKHTLFSVRFGLNVEIQCRSIVVSRPCHG